MFFLVVADIRTRQHSTARFNVREPYVGRSDLKEDKVDVEAEPLRERSEPWPISQEQAAKSVPAEGC